jgi:formate hydrogenlyase transcriptional activator
MDLIEARRLARELQHERDRLRLLLDLNNRVASDLDLRQVFQAISSEIRRIFKCDFVGLARPDSTGKQLRQHMLDFPESKGLMKEGALYQLKDHCPELYSERQAARGEQPRGGYSIWSSDPAFYRRVTEEGPFQSGLFPSVGSAGTGFWVLLQLAVETGVLLPSTMLNFSARCKPDCH